MTSADTFVCIDLETTGLDPQLNEIIEIGAVRVVDGVVKGEFSELVKPERSIPEFITRLTGISDRDVRNASSIREVMPRFLDFIKDYRILGQNVGFDISFVRRFAGIASIGSAIDNIDFARILLPDLSAYNLDSLIDFFALDPGKRHRALDDAKVTAEVFLKMIDMLRIVPDSFLSEMMKISSASESMLGEIFQSETLARMNDISAPTRRKSAPFLKKDASRNNRFGDFSVEMEMSDEPKPAAVHPSDIERILSNEGALAKAFDTYEERRGQISLSLRVGRAFNESEILIAEAGTGIGKSLAYLIPAIKWAVEARERVIVTTNTKNLQEQLFFKDIPLLGKVLDLPFRAVILKGRSNYICLHRWERLLSQPSRYLTKEEKSLMLPVASWLLKTSTGDLSETGFFSMLLETGLLERISSDTMSCLGGRCPTRDNCYVNRIRRAALKAHVVIVNHSLVFSDIVSDGAVLGQYSRIVFDEAHNIEKVALQYLGVNFSYYSIRRVLNKLYSKDGGEHGLLTVLREWTVEMAKGFPGYVDKNATVTVTIETLSHFRSVVRQLFEDLHTSVLKTVSSQPGRSDTKLRYDDTTEIFSAAADAREQFNDIISLLIKGLDDIKLIVSEASQGQIKDRIEVLADIEKSQTELQAIVDEFEFLRSASGPNVFWFEYREGGSAYNLKIHSAPLDIAEKLSIGLYDHMESVVMASATLTVARDFDYIRNRLGLNLDSRDRVTEFIATSPFDLQQQSILAVPSFLPSPKSDTYVNAVNDTILSLATTIRRGMLVLFTSRGHLHRSYNDLRDRMERDGITLMGQGIDGSRSLLLRRFREETKSVLFGTDSFWEGVDVPGSALEVVVIVKLPFAVPSDPLVQAQMEEIEKDGGNPFMEFSIPEAAIKLRQGAGRLIRHRNDRGVVVVLDNRIITARYGEIFRRCLPGTFRKFPELDQMSESLHIWFGDGNDQ